MATLWFIFWKLKQQRAYQIRAARIWEGTVAQAASQANVGTMRDERSLGARLVDALAGDFRYAPVLLAIVLIFVFFAFQNIAYISPRNISNMVLQTVVVGTIALGMVPILLIAEIDLAVAAIGATAATLMCVVVVDLGMASWLGVLSAVAFGALIGVLQGAWIARTRAPAFLITFGVSLALAGLQLSMLPETGQYNIMGTPLTLLVGTFLPRTFGWLLAIAAIAAFAVLRWLHYRDARKAGLDVSLANHVGLPVGLAAIALCGIVVVLSMHKGVPLAGVIFIGLTAIFSYFTSSTRYGLYLYAVGSNASAVARAGVSVNRIRLMAFALCGAFAAFGGVLGASRLLGVSAQSGAGGELLLAITAAVVGGTSLFGGRGSPWSAVIGSFAITAISNGMDLIGYGTEVKLATQGALLVAATSIDALVTRRPA